MKDKHGNPVPLSKMIDVPPVWLLGGLVLSWFLSKIDPLPAFGMGRIIGFIVLLLAAALLTWSVLVFRKARTPIHPRRKPTELIADGPFSFSRNPIYLAMVLVLISSALMRGSILAFAAVPLFGWIITTRFIRGEEFHIEKAFGDEWRSYAAKVRRWI